MEVTEVMNAICEDRLRHLYLVEGLSMKKISKILGVSIGSVYNYCRKYGIETRDWRENFNFRGGHHSAEAIQKIIAANTGKTVSDETKRKISEANKIHGKGHKKRRLDGYISVYYPIHPGSSKDGYILEHDLIMEEHIGRRLSENEVVHHKNKVRDDNRIENLELMTRSSHMSMHMKERYSKRRSDLSISAN